MKKLLLLATLLGTAASAFAQGQLSFRNNANTAFYIYTNTATRSLDGQLSSTRLMAYGANSVRIGLYASTTPGALEGSLTLVGLATNSATLNGRFLGASPLVLPAGYPSGTPITFQVRAWSLAGGMSYEEAVLSSLLNPLDIALGVSTIGTMTPNADPAPPAAIFGTTAGLIQGFEIRPVPEPSSIALGLLGLGAIALFRRKK